MWYSACVSHVWNKLPPDLTDSTTSAAFLLESWKTVYCWNKSASTFDVFFFLPFRISVFLLYLKSLGNMWHLMLMLLTSSVWNQYGIKKAQFYILVEPTNTEVLIVMCDHGVEDDAVFSTGDLDFTRRVGWGKKIKIRTHRNYSLMVHNVK